MGIKYLQIAFHIIDLILCTDGLINLLKFNQCTGLILHKDHSRNVPKIYKDIVKALMAVALGNRSNKDNLGGAVLNQKLLRIWVYQCLSFLSILWLLPLTVFIALQGNLPEQVINVTKVIKRTWKRLLTVHSLWSVESWIWLLHTNWFGGFGLLECGLAIFIRVTIMLFWCEIRHFGTYFAFVEIIKIGELVTLGFMHLAAVVLECTCSFTGSWLRL